MSTFGSVVVPDLLETMNSVRAISSADAVALICAGSVESSTRNVGQPGFLPNVFASTSGPETEPPMPSNNEVGKAAALHLFGKRPVVRQLRDTLIDALEPPQPFALVGAGPNRGVALPQPAHQCRARATPPASP